MFCHEVFEHAAFQADAVYVQSDQYRFVFVTLILLPWHVLQLKKPRGRDQYQYHGDGVLAFHSYQDVCQQRHVKSRHENCLRRLNKDHQRRLRGIDQSL